MAFDESEISPTFPPAYWHQRMDEKSRDKWERKEEKRDICR